VKPEPDWARAVALARRERGVRGGRGARQRLAFAVFLAAGLHAGAGTASLGAASDVPVARTQEVDAMKFSKLAATGAVLMASAASAGGKVPPGWMEVADSQAQFSSVQGQGGWTYLFDRGQGTAVETMQYYGSTGVMSGIPGWTSCPSFNYYCIQQGARMHANSAGECSAPWAGELRPIRRWTAASSLPVRINLVGSIASNTTALRVDLLVDGAVAFSQLGHDGLDTTVAAQLESVGQVVEVRLDPIGNNCHADVFDAFWLRILTPDCNANLIPDAVEIAAGSVYDRNHDGVPDVCQCLADVIENGVVDGADLAAVLTTWGTNGGIYPRADTNADGVDDGNDLAVVLGGWGVCP